MPTAQCLKFVDNAAQRTLVQVNVKNVSRRQRTYTVEGWAMKNFMYLDSNITEDACMFGQGCKSIWMFAIDNYTD